ncbi:MAG: serine/threonine protein kinase [Planctomycetota bacterium]|jgi:serine/threonine-protein kinase
MLDSITDMTRWEIDRTLASGGMGTVFLGRQIGAEGFEKQVAIKVLKDKAAQDPLYRRQIADEARLCANLVHENIVQIYQLLLNKGRYMVVMEYVEGVSLRQFIDRHTQKGERVPVELAAFITSRVCRALNYAHTQRDAEERPLGIVHRDICPNNILISLGGVVKLGDFGIAKANMLPQEEGKILQGKVRYMSPEQARYEVTDARSDLFSLSVVLWETLSGLPLFLADTTEQTMANVQHLPIQPIEIHRPELREQLQHIVGWGLERELKRRVPDASTFGYQLEYLLYHDGFGPTNDRLREHLEELFPELYEAKRAAVRAESADQTVRLPEPFLPASPPKPPTGASSDAQTRELPGVRPENAPRRRTAEEQRVDVTAKFASPFADEEEPPGSE